MAVLSNNGRLISSLPLASTVLGPDELLVQSKGITKRLPYAVFTSSILSPTKFNPYAGAVHFSSDNNKFTGSFYGPTNKLANFGVVNVRQGITVFGLTSLETVVGYSFNGDFTGSLFGDVKGAVYGDVYGTLFGKVTGSLLGNVKGNIISLGGEIDNTQIGSSTPSSIKGTKISASIGFNGPLIGDVYTQNGTKVLENGTTANLNGNVPSAFFYGTSSYANQALTAAYALSGLPLGGSPYQVVAKDSGGNSTWTNVITASNSGAANFVAVWDGKTTLKNTNTMYFNSVGGSWQISTPLIVNKITGSLYGTASYSLNAGGSNPGGISGSLQLYKTATTLAGTSKLRYRSGSLYVDGPVSASAISVQGVGIPQITSATDIKFEAASLGNGTVIVTQSPFRVASFTTTQRDAFVSPTKGDIIFNTTTNEFQGYNGTTWAVLG